MPAVEGPPPLPMPLAFNESCKRALLNQISFGPAPELFDSTELRNAWE